MPELDDSGALSEYDAKQVLRDAGIPTVMEQRATSVDEAVEYADEIGYPVILKIDSADIQHKSDIGAVMDAHDADAVRTRYDHIRQNVDENAPDAAINGMLVEEKVEGTELIVGVQHDPDFGHVVMVGIGGIFVETLNDVTFRAIPITRQDAAAMLDDLRATELLDGVRGNSPVDQDALIDVLVQVSRLVEDHPTIRELDINPLFADADGAVAADALITLEH
jgi:acetyltransferase